MGLTGVWAPRGYCRGCSSPVTVLPALMTCRALQINSSCCHQQTTTSNPRPVTRHVARQSGSSITPTIGICNSKPAKMSHVPLGACYHRQRSAGSYERVLRQCFVASRFHCIIRHLPYCFEGKSISSGTLPQDRAKGTVIPPRLPCILKPA